ncbi:oligopeptide ABC transporter substrate-binding protein [Lacticaseibacillus daqingensis]|uniref:oligopeptide ABC transporter substrate-binding protein n=1 Tax=Lacticaseibacillus daqingensis TaxID=2486014 RepID=UPI000F7701E5|nr:oligopeptide ABC transporter substrate-binding protein [Lacticaseibacillus daqingensis]
MKKKSAFGYVTLTAALSILLVACGGKSTSNNTDSSTAKSVSFSTAYKSSKAAIKGGTLNVAVVTDSPIKGIWSEQYYDDQTDADFMSPAAESLFSTDGSFKFTKDGAATITFDNDAKTATVKIKDNVKWSDGEPVTAQDYLFAYEQVANKDSETQRYTGALQNLEGLTEYHDGKSDSISGFEMPDGPDGKTAVLHFKEMKPSFTQSGNGYFLESAAPYHYLKDVPFKDMAASDKILKTPLFFGPFVMSKIVAGQSVEYTPNKYYYKGVPKLDKVTAEVVSSSSIAAALKNHKYDLALEMPTATYDNWKKISGYTNLGKEELSYTYLAFKVGKFDNDKSVNVLDKNAKMNNKSLRQAMAYALNNDDINAKFYPGGLRTTATTLIPPIFGEFHSDAKGYTLNIKKANSLLDKAGYKKGKDGYRTDPDGKKLTINFASMAGSDAAEAIAQDYIQQWKKIGLRVKLTSGRLLDYNNFYDKVEKDSKDIDVFQAAWGLSSEPSPADLYSEEAPYNMARFVTAENTKLLNDIDSQASLNTAHRVKAFKAWQDYMLDEAYVVPLQYRMAVTPVNNRVKNFNIAYGSDGTQWQDIQVTSASRAK